MNMEDLEEKLKDVIGEQFDIQREFKDIENQLKTLDKNISHGEVYKENRKYKVEYNKLYSEYKTAKKLTGFGAKRKMQKALDTANEYRRKYKGEISSFDTAKQHLKDVLQAQFDPKKHPPITKWKVEKTELLRKKSALDKRYQKAKSVVDNVSKIRTSAYNILARERKRLQQLQPQNKKPKYRGMERG